VDALVNVLHRVVITGLGVVAGPDCGTEALTASLGAAAMKTVVVDDRQGYHVPGSSRRAVLSTGVDLSPWVPPAVARRMSPPSRLAVAATQMALVQSGLAGAVGGLSTGVVLSSSLGPVTSTEQLLDVARRDGPQAVSPFAFAESVANAAAGQVAIFTKAQGPNLTIVQREAGSLTAIGRGAALIASGHVDRVLAGTVDEMPPLLHALIGRFEALAKPDEMGAEIARPFDARRNGFVVAEGAVVVVLEREDLARARGARILGRIRGFAGAFDATAPRLGWGGGSAALAGAVDRMLKSAGCRVSDVTRIVSGASGAVAGDRIEADVLKAVWAGAPLPTILVPKAYVGQYGGGFLAGAVLSVSGGLFGKTPGFESPDPALGIHPFAGGLLTPAPLSLFTTIGSGGSASWLLVESA
jgi:3-oxoacyl-[acyl-carrier-protein] synthase II